MSEERFELTLEQQEGFQFRVDFDQPGVPALEVDEPPPLGTGRGPNPARLLAAAVGNCLSASLLFCLKKARIEDVRIGARVEGSIVRNERNRFRIGGLKVVLSPEVTEADPDRMRRCLSIFEDFCIVTESVRDGIDVEVKVEPVVDGNRLEGVAPLVEQPL